jgi:hypothetical protein
MEPGDRDTDRIRAALRDAAGEFQPDRTAIASRVAAGRSAAGPERDRGRRTLRVMLPAGAAFAVVGVLVASVAAAQLNDPPDGTVADPPPAASAAAQSGSPEPSGQRTTSTTAPAFLVAEGNIDKNSVATWTEQTVTMRTTEPVDHLEVTIAVALSPGVAKHGFYTTVPNNDLGIEAHRTAEALVYTYTLKDGVRLRPGTYLFAAQFKHRSGRSTRADAYTVTAGSRSGDATEDGRFG